MTRFYPVAAAVLAVALTTAGCGSGSETRTTDARDAIKVSGAFGSRPTITVDSPLKVSETSAWTATRGDGGDTVGAQSRAILQLTLADGRTGKTAISTQDAGQKPLEVQLGDQVFPSLAQALTGKSAGTRVVVASTSDDAYGDQGSPQIGIKGGDPVVIVADVLSVDPTSLADGPSGATARAPVSAPTVVEKGGVPASLDFGREKKPKKYAAYLLRAGTGKAIDDPDRVAVKYVGQVWGAKKPFEETYSGEPALVSVGLGNVIRAWDRALVGLKEGSRVMIVCPPATAYGATAQGPIPANATLVFVVDVLGVG